MKNNKLGYSDTDTDIPYHVQDLVRLTHLHQRVGLKATTINGSRYSTNHNTQCTMLPPYNIYSALRSAIHTSAPVIIDIDSKLTQFKVENKKLRALGSRCIIDCIKERLTGRSPDRRVLNLLYCGWFSNFIADKIPYQVNVPS